MSHRMSPKTRVVFKFIFGLGIWSFLVLGFFKLNGDQVTPHQFQQTPINGRLLLNKDNRWTGNEATSTTTDRYASPVGAGVDEVLVDNRAGEFRGVFFLGVLVSKEEHVGESELDVEGQW